MNAAQEILVALTVVLGGLGGIITGVTTFETYKYESLECRVVMGVLAGLLAPFVWLMFLPRALRFLGRGVRDLYHIVGPVKKTKLPEARVVR